MTFKKYKKLSSANGIPLFLTYPNTFASYGSLSRWGIHKAYEIDAVFYDKKTCQLYIFTNQTYYRLDINQYWNNYYKPPDIPKTFEDSMDQQFNISGPINAAYLNLKDPANFIMIKGNEYCPIDTDMTKTVFNFII